MARLSIHDGSTTRTVELTDATTVAGRSSENKIHIEDKQASRKHFQVEKTEFGYKVVDLESRNGTRVNDRVVNQALLRPGDRIVVGKHTLTFEDPAFKEPPAEVAARFAPPSSPPPPPPDRPVNALDPDPTLPAGGGPETRMRRRSGATTSIERVARIEAAKEKNLVTYVGVGAGVFVFILLVLVLLPSGGGGESPAASAARDTFGKAQELFRKGKFDEAEQHLSRIPADQKQWFTQAQGMSKEIAAARARKTTETSEAEKKAFLEIDDLNGKRKTDAALADAVAAKGEAFKKAYPRSEFLPKVEEYLGDIAKARKAARGGEIAESEKKSQEALEKSDYAGALKTIIALRDKYKDDFELSERLLKVHDDIIEKAKAHTNKRVAEAKELVEKGLNPDAIKILEEIVAQMGSGDVEALADYALRARTTLQGLK